MEIHIEIKSKFSRGRAALLSTSALVATAIALQSTPVHATCTTTGNETECTDEVRTSSTPNTPLFDAAAQTVDDKQLMVESSTLTTTGQGSPVIFNGSVDTSISTTFVGDSVLTSRGNDAPAIESLGSQNIGSTTTVIQGSTIQTEGENSVAFISATGAEDSAVHTIVFSESNFLTTGEESGGIVVHSGALGGSAFDFSLTSSDVITKGDLSVGVNVDARSGFNSAISVRIGDSDVADAVSISTSGAYSTGLSTGSQADANSVSNMKLINTTISTTGLGAAGFYAIVGADNESTVVLELDANKITTSGDIADGIVLFSSFGNLLDSFSSKSTVAIENTTVTTTGRLANALVIGQGLVFDTALQTNGATEVSITADNFGNFLATGEGGRGIQNNGTIIQGANGLEFGAGVAQRISNNGVIQGSGSVAVTFDQTTDTDDLFEIQSGARTMGNVLAGGGMDTLVLGGQDNAVFDRGLVGTQYLDFERFVKEDNSTFTLTTANDLQWTIVGGELAIADSNLQTGETQFFVSTGITRGLDATTRQVVQSTTGKLTVNDGVSISTSTDGIAVVQVQGDGIVNVKGEISTSGNAANGVEIVDKGLVTSSGIITTTGDNSNGIYGSGTAGVAITYTGAGSDIIKTGGTGSNGIFAESTGGATINAVGNISVGGLDTTAIRAINTGSGAATITSSATIVSDGNGGRGIFAESSGGATINATGNISVGGTDTTAIQAINTGSSAATITSSATIKSGGSGGRGIVAESSGDATINAAGNISVDGMDTSAIRAINTGSGAATITSSATIESRGNGGRGIVAESSGDATISAMGNISMGGTDTTAIRAENRGAGAATITSSATIKSDGNGGRGIVAESSGDATINAAGNISVDGMDTSAIRAINTGSGAATITSSATIESRGNGGRGIVAESTGGATINAMGNISMGGTDTTAIRAENRGAGAATITSSATIESRGNGGRGIVAESSGGATINATGNISVGGVDTTAIRAINTGSGDATIASSATITGEGNQGRGISAEVQSGGGTATVTNSGAISVNGTEAIAIHTIASGDGDVVVSNGGNLTATGPSSSGIHAEAEGAGSTTVDISKGTVSGTNGVIFKAKAANQALLSIGASATVKTSHINAVVGGLSDDTVEHKGRIEGNVQLGSGDDTFVLFPTAVLAGTVNFEAGTDTLAVDGASGTTGNIALMASGKAFGNDFEVIEKRGQGTWVFDGDDLTATAPNISARIMAGTAIINANLTTVDVVNQSAGRLEGVGGVRSLINNGVFSPGGNNVAGTFSVFGPLTLGNLGTLNVDIFDDGSSDLITVNGNTTLAGALAVNGVNFPTGFPNKLDYTIISSSNTTNTISGNFDTVSDNLPDVDVSVTVNQAADTNADRVLDKAANVVVSFDRGGDESDKSIIPNSLQAGASAGRAFNNMLQTRSKQLVRPSNRSNFNSSSSYRYGLETNAAPATSNDLPIVYDAWANIFGSWDRIDSTSRASAYTARLGGFSGGFGSTHTLDGGQTVYLGGAVGYSVTNVDSGVSESEIDTAHFATYGSLNQDAWLFSGALAYAHQSYKVDRQIPLIGGAPLSASAKADGTLLTASMEIAYNVANHLDGLDEQTRISPFVSLEYAHVNRDGYRESGAGILNQSVASHSYHQTWGAIGFEYATTMVMDNDVILTPSFTLAYEHAFDDLEANVSSSIVGLANGDFQNRGASLGENAVRLGMGLGVEFTEKISAQFQYSGAFSSGSRSHSASASLTFKF